MRKILLFLLISALILVGCQQEPETPAAEVPPAEEAPMTEAEVVLRFALWDSNQVDFSQESIDLFEEQNPNIKVELELVGWDAYWEKILATFAGDEGYDVFWMDTYNFINYASKGGMMDLTPYIQRDNLDVEGMYGEGRLVNVKLDGKIYAIPKDSDDPAVYYNKDLFDKYEVSYPEDDWTWDDLEEKAAQLTHPEDGVWGFTTGVFFGGPDWWNWVWQNGADILSEDSTTVLLDQSKACDALKWWYGLVEKEYAPDGTIMQTSDPVDVLFPTQKVAMIYFGQWMLAPFAELPFNMDVAPVPAGPEGKALQVGGLNYAIWSGTPHPEEAWKFVKFMGSKEAMDIQAKAGVIIPALTSSQALWADTYPDLNIQATFLDMLPYGRRPAFVGWEWNNEVNLVLMDAWSGNMTIDEACVAASEAGTAALAKNK
jgi:multiple sugar transport system substrate-binding protein